ncbi:MAG: hypothetical protein DLM52_01055 [Chthoniobacterales bacterium]|nr:MAG: hypothetical protein DLM52_01055 [Chthoniobacterales bacterium]
MIPSPIVKVLSTIQKHGVKALLMGGQACVFYGAAEFSRDADLVILAAPGNLDRLRTALRELNASQIFVPELSEEVLRRGHAVHFRCAAPEADRVRVDVMSVLRGVDDFDQLWERRTTLSDDAGNQYDLLSLPDLVQAKKTQRDKDWPMIMRLIEANYVENRATPSEEQVRFWFKEMRSPQYLIELSLRFASLAEEMARSRSLLRLAVAGEHDALEAALASEQKTERVRDRIYWQPLRKELEQLRWNRT